jgi:prefoldin subunit 5
LRQARVETDERVRREVAAEKSRYDREISSLQSRLSSMDQTSLINRLRGRIEELEDQVRRYEYGMGGGGQVVFIPGIGFARIGYGP